MTYDQIGRHRLYHDYHDIPSDVKADCLITDPPWSVTNIGFDKAGFDMDDLCVHMARWMKPEAWLFMFGTVEMAAVLLKYFRYKFEYIWHKPSPMLQRPGVMRPVRNHEIIYTFITKELKKMGDLYMDKMSLRTKGEPYTRAGNRRETEFNKAYGYGSSKPVENPGYREGVTILKFKNKSHMAPWERTEHPTQKPIELLKKLAVGYCRRDRIILDPTAGSGSALMAAEFTGRTFIGAEIDPEYRRMIHTRFNATLGRYV